MWAPKGGTPRNGTMTKVLVYDNEHKGLIGTGWVIVRDDGRIARPVLYDLMGIKLAEGWYQIVATDEVKMVVIPRSIQ